MKQIKKLLVLAVMSIFLVACGGSSDNNNVESESIAMQLKPLGENDRGSTALDNSLGNIALPNVNTRKDAVSYTQVIDDGGVITTSSKAAYTDKSKRFKMQVSAEALASGVTLPVSSTEPVVQIVSENAVSELRSDQIEFRKSGAWISGDQAFNVVADKNELTAAGMKTSRNTLAMKLKPGVGEDSLAVRVKGIPQTDLRYSVHVLEPQSDNVLALNVANTKLLKGDSLQFDVSMTSSAQVLSLDSVSGYLVAPQSSQKIPVDLEVNNGIVDTTVDTSQLASSGVGLWELHIASQHGQDENLILRNAKVAFALSPKTGIFNDQVSVSTPGADGGSLKLEFNIETALPGRYSASAVVYGQDSEGQQKAGAVVSAAQWMEASGVIVLEVEHDKLLEAGIEAPFEIRHLTMQDQTRMAELWSQSSALTIHQ